MIYNAPCWKVTHGCYIKFGTNKPNVLYFALVNLQEIIFMANNRVHTISDGSMDIAMGHSVTAHTSVVRTIATGTLARVQNTYASHYNHVVKCWESFDSINTKRQMRAGYFGWVWVWVQ
jgi:hypothetical protein